MISITKTDVVTIIILVLANIILIVFHVQVIDAIVNYAHSALPQREISLEKSDVQFLLNKTNKWVDEKVVGITNRDKIKLSYNISEFYPQFSELPGVVSVIMYPKNGPQMMIIDVNGSQLVNLPKSWYHAQIRVYKDSIAAPVSTIYVNLKLSK